ncbi:protein TIFY 5A [Elaeis guineensis]|uniref:Protein TIFY n=1 Tax=Elaeis guineensis var. tenera TaxID=51953 RepID=A0A6I9QEE4_ELAGV|nr:protein TIFY 5A [Elaeis guineensis]
MAGSGCDPELRLSLGSSSSQDCSAAESSRIDGWSANSEQKQQQQKITIFYNGQICVCDVTEFQAKAIICMAQKEMNDKMNKNHHNQQQQQFQQKHNKKSNPPQPPASSSEAMPQLLNQGLSMKRSLQRFLQKRKTRINAASPYNNRHELLFSSTS